MTGLRRQRGSIVVVIPVKLPVVQPGQKLSSLILRALDRNRLNLLNGDVVCVASKVISAAEGRITLLESKKVSKLARRYADKYKMNSKLAQTVVDEADKILGGVHGFLLTTKSGILTANAGIDVKNSPPETATLWPIDPDRSARLLRRSLQNRFRRRIGVMIVDSRIAPLRLGTTGLAIGSSGFQVLKDDRGKPDLYGRTVKVTQLNVADDIAASAHLLMAERDERIGLVIIRNAPVLMTNNGRASRLKIIPKKCLFWSSLAK